MQTRFVKVILTIIGLHCVALAGTALASDCKAWNSGDYFQAATLEEVADCLRSGVDLKKLNEDGNTPLHSAAGFCTNPAVIATLVKAGADLEARDRKFGNTPLHLAAESNDNPLIVAALLDAGAPPNARSRYRRTPLHEAALSNENPAILATLLDAGADPNARDSTGNTPLHLAARYSDNPATVAALLDGGADPKRRNKEGETSWDLAQNREPLKGSDAYWRLNDGRF